MGCFPARCQNDIFRIQTAWSFHLSLLITNNNRFSQWCLTASPLYECIQTKKLVVSLQDVDACVQGWSGNKEQHNNNHFSQCHPYSRPSHPLAVCTWYLSSVWTFVPDVQNKHLIIIVFAEHGTYSFEYVLSNMLTCLSKFVQCDMAKMCWLLRLLFEQPMFFLLPVGHSLSQPHRTIEFQLLREGMYAYPFEFNTFGKTLQQTFCYSIIFDFFCPLEFDLATQRREVPSYEMCSVEERVE